MNEPRGFLGRLYRSKENTEIVSMKKEENPKQMNVLNSH